MKKLNLKDEKARNELKLIEEFIAKEGNENRVNELLIKKGYNLLALHPKGPVDAIVEDGHIVAAKGNRYVTGEILRQTALELIEDDRQLNLENNHNQIQESKQGNS